MENPGLEHIDLPAGFRFHPTDEELILHYLCSKTLDVKFTAAAIGEVDLNKCEPWDLPKVAKMGEKEWYFFSLRDRKYPTGLRTNRSTDAGYWKATGKDKEIHKARSLVGLKKTLVFYHGRAPKGEKTNWIMHEYRLSSSPNNSKEEWVVCRIFHKNSGANKNLSSNETISPQTDQIQFMNPQYPIMDPNYFSQGYCPINEAPYPVYQPQIDPFIGSYSEQNMFNGGGLGTELNQGISGTSYVDQAGPSTLMEPFDIDSIWNF